MTATPLSFEDILSHFPGPRKPNGQGGFNVKCPAHAGRGTTSLSISPGNGAGPLFHCFAGCETETVLEAAGLTWQDVLPGRETKARKPALRAASRTPGEFRRYDITDVTGKHLRYHVREDLPGGKKNIHWETADGRKKLDPDNIGLKLEHMQLYGIDRLIDAPAGTPVVVTEGEKAADALLSNGIVAVGTVTGASGTPSEDALRPLLSRPILLWPDNDFPGIDHMGRILESLLRLGHRNVRLINWKDAPAKGDAADFVLMEGWRDDYDILLEEASLPEGVRVPPPLFESLATLLLDPPRPRWFVHGLIEKPSTGAIIGPSGSGKTFILVDLTGTAAVMGKWMGRDIMVNGPVFYLAGEGKAGLLRRFAAWQLHRKVAIPENRLFVSTSRVELDEKGAETVKAEVGRISNEVGAPPSLIAVDTLARSLPPGADENSARDMGAFVNVIDSIRDQFGSVFVIVHHTGHEAQHRARGSSSFRAAMDFELCVGKRGGERVAEWSKLKDLPDEPQAMEFVLEKVQISADEGGELVSSAVVSWQGRASVKSAVSTTKTEVFGLDTLRVAIAKSGGTAPLESWRTVFYGRHWGENDGAKRKAFGRIRESLAGKGFIRIDDGLYSIPTKQDIGTEQDKAGHCPEVSRDRTGHTPIGVSRCPALAREEQPND